MALFGGLLLVMALAALDQTIIATALPSIVRDLGGLRDVSAVVTAYVLAATASTPLWGKLSDRLGRRPVFQAALAAFLLGSIACGAAGSIGELIAFRAVQGLGGGGLMTLAWTVVADIVAPRDRGRYQAYIQGTFAAASIIGPLAGGLFSDDLSWRWIFYVNLPLGAAALAVLSLRLGPPQRQATGPLDWRGALLLAAGVVALLAVCELGGEDLAWGSPALLALGAGALALLGAFAAVERRAADPVLPPRLLGQRSFALTCAALLLATCALFSVTVFVPVFLQAAQGLSATGSGALLLPLMLAVTASGVGAGAAMSASGRSKPFPLAGLALMTAGLGLLSTIDAGTSRAAVTVAMVVFGLGFGMVSSILLVMMQNTIERRELGTATGAANLFRGFGGAIGTALFGAIFSAGATGDVAAAVGDVFLVAAPLAAVAFALVVAIPEAPLAEA